MEFGLTPVQVSILTTLALCERSLTLSELMAYNEGETTLTIEAALRQLTEETSYTLVQGALCLEVNNRFNLTDEGKVAMELIVGELNSRME